MAQQQQRQVQQQTFSFPQRTSPQGGSPLLRDPSKVKIVYNAELHRPCCEAYELAEAYLKHAVKCMVKQCPIGGICLGAAAPMAAPAAVAGLCCSLGMSTCLYFLKPKLDYKRSYVYVRENAVETNQAYKCCCGPCVTKKDFTGVMYFDDEFYDNSSCSPVCLNTVHQHVFRLNLLNILIF